MPYVNSRKSCRNESVCGKRIYLSKNHTQGDENCVFAFDIFLIYSNYIAHNFEIRFFAREQVPI